MKPIMEMCKVLGRWWMLVACRQTHANLKMKTHIKEEEEEEQINHQASIKKKENADSTHLLIDSRNCRLPLQYQ